MIFIEVYLPKVTPHETSTTQDIQALSIFNVLSAHFTQNLKTNKLKNTAAKQNMYANNPQGRPPNTRLSFGSHLNTRGGRGGTELIWGKTLEAGPKVC